jgi:hypothetical protein
MGLARKGCLFYQLALFRNETSPTFKQCLEFKEIKIMSFKTQTNKSGNVQGAMLVVKPSAAQWSDIEELQPHNRGANEPEDNLSELYKSVKARGEFVTPLKGYLENKQLFITAGSRRLAVGHKLENEGEEILLPVVLINKPESADDIRGAISDNLADNNFRNADSPEVLYNSFKSLRNLGWSLEEIGDATGFSHTQVGWYTRTMDIPVLKKAIMADEISPRAAADFITEQYVLKGKDGKPVAKIETRGDKKVKVKQYDEEKIASELKKAKASANAAGKSKIGGKSSKADKATDEKGSVLIRGMKAVRIILDEPEDNVPSIFRQYNKWLNGELTDENFKKIAKKNGYWDEIEWLFEIEFDADKRKAAKDAAKAAKDKAKAEKASKEKKANPQVSKDDDELDAEDYE